MLRFLSCVFLFVALVFTCAVSARAERSTFGERLLPNTTRGVVLVTNVDQLAKQWDQTQLGQLMADPVMEPFAKDLRRQFQDRFSRLRDRLGLELDDLRGVPSGEMDIAIVQPAKDQAAIVLLVDVTGNIPKAKEMLRKVSENLKRKGATERAETHGGLTLLIYDVPETPDSPKGQVAYSLSEEDALLAAADHLDAIKDIIKRKAGQGATGGSLADATAFQKIMARCQKHAGEAVPQIRWFVDPIGYAECVRIMTPEDKRRKGVVITDVFRNQGFDAIQGIGGYIDFKVDQYDLLHRTAVYAPGPYAKAPEPYVNKVGMEILTFPNTSDYSLPPFIPNDVATCTMFHWDLLKVFDNVGPTFNELFADKGDTTMFDDLIRDFEEDEFGPQINLREELVKHFDHRVTIISDYILPITTKSERLLFAVKVRDAEKVAAGIKKLLKDDPTIERREFEGLEIWETIEQDEMHLPSAPVIDLPDLAPEKKATPSKRERRLGGDEEDEELLLPHAAVTVVHGHLLVASHYDYLVEILTRAKQPEPLAESMDFRTVASAMDALGAGGDFLRAFSRTDEEYRPTYELIRQGKMPEAETMFARMLNSLFGPHKPGVVREQKVDGKEMPDYQIVRRYLGPAGTFGRTEEDGWFVVGFMLKK